MPDADGFGPDHLASHFDVSRETLDRLIETVAILDDWRKRINLIGPAEFDRVWRRHIFDSLQLLPLVRGARSVVDLGSGAGFPALVLAAALRDHLTEFTLIETVGKKCAFLREVSTQIELRAKIRQARVEAVTDVEADLVTARAFAPLPRLLDYAQFWLLGGAVGVFPKGRRWEEELTAAQESWKFSYEAIPSISGDGVILKISEVSRVST